MLLPAGKAPLITRNAMEDLEIELARVLYGSDEMLALRNQAAAMLAADPLLADGGCHDLTRAEALELTARKIVRLRDVERELAGGKPGLLRVFLGLAHLNDASLSMRAGVHSLLFHECMRLLGTDEQYEALRERIASLDVIGCFAMTELGHSSNLRGLETTATYDSAGDCFVIHTPTLLATKWWIGMAGQTATHTVALAQLVVGTQQHGLHWFLVPLRDRATGGLLPGIQCGDLGAKMGRPGLDNGYIRFHSVRVPRSAMLARFATVDRAGVVRASPVGAKLAYNVLLSERVACTAQAFSYLAKGVTIAVRYSMLRRQGSRGERIIDYNAHAGRLLPYLAGTYALGLAARALESQNERLIQLQLACSGEDAALDRELASLHTASAGLKAFGSWYAHAGLEICRQSLGGHGYSAYNEIPSLLADWAVLTTGGGDNIVLAQQVAAALVKTALRAAASGDPATAYLASAAKAQAPRLPDPADAKAVRVALSDLRVQERLLAWCSIATLRPAAAALAAAADHASEWNAQQATLVAAAEAHVNAQLFRALAGAAEARAGTRAGTLLHSLASLFALDRLARHGCGLLLDTGVFAPGGAHTEALRSAVLALVCSLRDDSAELAQVVNGLHLPDVIVRAPLGLRDPAPAYERYFARVQRSPAPAQAPYWQRVFGNGADARADARARL